MDAERYPELKFLNPESEIDRTRNRVPHWQQEGRTYFLTFRLNDSIPRDLLERWHEERDAWRAAHPPPWTPEREQEYHRRFSLKIDRWMDAGMGSCLLGEPGNRDVMAEALRFFDGERYGMHAFVVMPNHVHACLSLHPDWQLENLVAGWKRFTARKIGHGSIWQKSYFDRMIRDWDHLMNVARYISNNPGKARVREERYALYVAPWVERLLG